MTISLLLVIVSPLPEAGNASTYCTSIQPVLCDSAKQPDSYGQSTVANHRIALNADKSYWGLMTYRTPQSLLAGQSGAGLPGVGRHAVYFGRLFHYVIEASQCNRSFTLDNAKSISNFPLGMFAFQLPWPVRL